MTPELVRFRDRFGLPTAVDGAGRIDAKESGLVAGRVIVDAYALVYVTQGGGFYFDAQTPAVPVQTGDLLVLFPGLVQGYGPTVAGNWSERFLVFHGAVFEHLEQEGLLDRRHCIWRVGMHADILDAFDTVIERFRAPAIDQAWCAARTHLLLVETARRAEHRQGDFVAEATAALAEDEACQRPLDQIAQRFGLSEQVFRKRFAKLVGMPPARWRQQRRLERAKSLLTTSDASLAVIAERLGWCDQFFFARQFKQGTGQTPAGFRRAFRGR